MKILHYIVIGLISASFCFLKDDDCGVARWDVKTLTDTKVKNVNFKPKRSSIRKLGEIKVPVTILNNTPRLPAECNTYIITCRITQWRLEEDGDYHLVLVDIKDSTKTMVGEIPDPECEVMADCPKLTEITYARNDFYAKYKLPKHKVEPGTYQVTGVFFFDRKHNQLGMAPNGAELHPIIGIKKLN
jgi:hypothetical protein